MCLGFLLERDAGPSREAGQHLRLVVSSQLLERPREYRLILLSLLFASYIDALLNLRSGFGSQFAGLP